MSIGKAAAVQETLLCNRWKDELELHKEENFSVTLNFSYFTSWKIQKPSDGFCKM